MAARPPRICAASGETACQAARVSPSRPHSHASRWRAGTSPAPTPGPVRSSASVGAVLVAARPPRICAASGETACQAARVSPSRPHSHASRWRAGTSPAPTPGPVRSSASVGAVLVAARPPRICAASGETACQAARVSPSRPHSHASRSRAGTTPAPTPGPARSPASVGAALVAARPHDSGRVKWARGSGRSHSTTAPAARDLGTSISRWLALPRNRAA